MIARVLRLLRPLRYVWALPNTLVGLIVALLALLAGGRTRRKSGVLEVQGGAPAWLLRHMVPLRGGAAAITLGHVIIARDERELERTRAHERVHVRQAECWGPLFIPAYVVASLIAVLRGGNAYRDNVFEVEAREGEDRKPLTDYRGWRDRAA
ncbi:MAG TPA: hypothetical protein VF190_03055 [Rhodothermales bacterium]